MKDAWFKWVVNRWFAGTRNMSYAAKGLYADLITCWRDGQRVPADERRIADMTGARDWRSVNKPLAELFKRGKVYERDGYLFNATVEEDIAERDEQRQAVPKRKRGGNDTEGGEGGNGPQGALPFRPVLVGGTGDKREESGEDRARIADSPPMIRKQSANCSRSRCAKPLIFHETGFASESPEWRDQKVVAAVIGVAARARGDPSGVWA